MLTSLPTYSFYKSSYSYNFIKHITLPFCLIPFMFLISFYDITYSVRRFGFHSYHLLSTLQLTSIRIFLNAGSFFANLPAVSGVSLTLACKIFTRLWHLWNQIIQLIQFSMFQNRIRLFANPTVLPLYFAFLLTSSISFASLRMFLFTN